MGRMIHPEVKEILAYRPSISTVFQLSVFAILAAIIGLLLYFGAPAMIAGSSAPVELVVYGFSTQEEVFGQQIFPAFERMWENRTNRDLVIEGVFGASGTLANQIVLGAPADVAIFSNAQHITWLRLGRLVDQETQAVIIGCTPMVIVTREGNPANVADFTDLAKPGLRLLHAEPGRSGAGDWAVLAEFGSVYLAESDRRSAEVQLESIWNNIEVLGTSARATLTLFELGAGDALVTYEQDALFAADRGISLEIIMPPRTIIAQHVAVVIDANVTRTERMAAEDFLEFLLSESGADLLAQYHLRPPVIEDEPYPEIQHPFTVEELGGWSQAYWELVEGNWERYLASRLTGEPLPRLSNLSDDD